MAKHPWHPLFANPNLSPPDSSAATLSDLYPGPAASVRRERGEGEATPEPAVPPFEESPPLSQAQPENQQVGTGPEECAAHEPSADPLVLSEISSETTEGAESAVVDGHPSAEEVAKESELPSREGPGTADGDSSDLLSDDLPTTPSQRSGHDTVALINLLTNLIEYRDPYFRAASSFTRHLAAAIARRFGLSDAEIVRLEYAALLRDVGRMALNGMLIPPTTQVGSGERYRIEQHVTLGLEMTRDIPLPEGTREAIQHHHENWDGSGYPDGLRGEQIPILSRILQVADSFAAMISARPYRPPKRFSEAIREISEGAGTLYDPSVVDALIEIVTSHEYRTAGFGLHDHILIVHPDQPRAVRLAVELCARGYLAEVALDLASARGRLPGIPVSAILMTANLPDGDGGEFIESIRAEDRLRDIPILGFDLAGPRQRMMMIQAGADAAFSGDTLLEEVLGTLGAAVSRTRRLQLQRDQEVAETPTESTSAGGVESPFSGLRGNLRDFPLSWLCQTMQYYGRSGLVTLESPSGNGTIILQDGKLRHAETEGATGEDAFNEILDWTDGYFRVEPTDASHPRTISRPMIHIMLEHAAYRGERQDLFGAVATS